MTFIFVITHMSNSRSLAIALIRHWLKSLIALWLFSFALNCAKDTPPVTNDPPPLPDSNVVLRIDSMSLYGNFSQYVEQSFNFSKKLRKIEYQFWGDENCTISNIPFIKFEFISTSDTETVSYDQFDSIPMFIMHNLLFHEGDSCQAVTIKIGITDPPYVNKYIKLKDIKFYSTQF